MIYSDFVELIGLLLGVFGLGFTNGFLMLVFKKSVGIISK